MVTEADDLVWAVCIAVIAAAITASWVPDMPAPLLWAGYVGFGVAVVLFIRWWLGVVR